MAPEQARQVITTCPKSGTITVSADRRSRWRLDTATSGSGTVPPAAVWNRHRCGGSCGWSLQSISCGCSIRMGVVHVHPYPHPAVRRTGLARRRVVGALEALLRDGLATTWLSVPSPTGVHVRPLLPAGPAQCRSCSRPGEDSGEVPTSSMRTAAVLTGDRPGPRPTWWSRVPPPRLTGEAELRACLRARCTTCTAGRPQWSATSSTRHTPLRAPEARRSALTRSRPARAFFAFPTNSIRADPLRLRLTNPHRLATCGRFAGSRKLVPAVIGAIETLAAVHPPVLRTALFAFAGPLPICAKRSAIGSS